MTVSSQKEHFKENATRFIFDLDDYEKSLVKKYIEEQC